jgi:transketolase
MRHRFERVTLDLLAADPDLALALAEIGTDSFERLIASEPWRVLSVGIREQLMVGVAAGLALAGYRPIVHTYAPFLVERPFEQLKLDFGHNDLGGVFVSVGASFDAASNGRTHQAPEDVAILATLPGWRIDVPGHPDEVERLLRTAASGTGRTYIRLSSIANHQAVELPPDGGMAVIRQGGGPVVVAVGPMLDPVLAAVDELDLTILYTATVRPFDGATLRAVLREPAVALVEPYLAGTSAAAVSDPLHATPHRLLALGVRKTEHRRYGSPADHLVDHGLDPASLRRQLTAFLNADA